VNTFDDTHIERGDVKRVLDQISKSAAIIADKADRNHSDAVCVLNSSNNILAVAGTADGAKWCHVLRKNCETDWAQRFPQYVISAWSGHSIEVSARHYLQVPEELYKEASASKSLQDATKCQTAGRPK